MLGDFKWLPVFRATIGMLALEIWSIITILGFLSLIFDTQIMPKSFFNWYSLVIGLFLIWTKYYVFDKDDKWREIVKEFDGWSRTKHTIGVILFISLIILILGSFIFMLYLTGKKSGTI